MLKIIKSTIAASAVLILACNAAVCKPLKTAPPPASDFQKNAEPAQTAPADTETSQPENTQPFLSEQKGRIEVRFLYPRPGEQCGNAGLYSLTIPSPLEKDSEIEVFVSRDTLDVRSDPPKVFDFSIFRGEKDDLKLVLFGLITGTEQTIGIKAFSEKDTPGEAPLYDKQIKLKLEPDATVAFEVSGQLDKPPAIIAATEEPPLADPPADSVPIRIGVMSMPLKNMPIDIGKPPPPFEATAGADFDSQVNEEVALKGNSVKTSGPKNIRYTWRQITGPKVNLTDWDTPTALFKPVKSGKYVFEYEIYDGSDISLDSVSVNVKGPSFFFNTPSVFSKLDIGFMPSNFVLIGNTLVVPNGTEDGTKQQDNNLLFIDISDPKNPVAKSNYKIEYKGVKSNRLMVSGGSFIYTIYETEKETFHLLILNASNMESPRVVGEMPIKGTPKLIVPGERLLYLCTVDAGLQIIDISSPGKPNLKSTFPTNEDIATGALYGKTFMLVTRTKLVFIDISDPAKPSETASFPIRFSFTNDSLVMGSNILVFAAPAEDSPLLKGETMPLFRAFDVSDPTNPKEASELIGKIGMIRANTVNGNYLYMIHVIRKAEGGTFVDGECFLEIYDLSDMKNIRQVSSYAVDLSVQTMGVMGDYVIFNRAGEIVILRVSG